MTTRSRSRLRADARKIRIEALREAADRVYILAHNGAEPTTWDAGRRAAWLAIRNMIYEEARADGQEEEDV